MSTPKWPRTITVGHASVKVYRNREDDTKSGVIYVLAWSSPTGRKREKFADEEEALKEARLKAGQLSAGKVEGASMSTGDRDELQAARKLANGVPVLAALEEWVQARALTAGNILPACEQWAARNGKAAERKKITDIVTEFLAAKTKANRKISRDHAYTFRKIKEGLGEQMIDEVSSVQLDSWLSSWAHPVTRNTRRKRLVSVWRWARDKGYLARGVTTEAELTDVATEEAPVIGIINVERFEKILGHIRAKHPSLLAPLVVAGFCGLRRTEVHGQSWEDINLERKFVRVTAAKRNTPARRLVPLSDAAVAWLMLCKNRNGPICPMVEGANGPQPSLAVDAVRRIVKDDELFPSYELPQNCFRHSYISHAVMATGDIPRVALNAGTSVKKVHSNYRELVTEDEGNAWFEILPAVGAKIIKMAIKKATA